MQHCEADLANNHAAAAENMHPGSNAVGISMNNVKIPQTLQYGNANCPLLWCIIVFVMVKNFPFEHKHFHCLYPEREKIPPLTTKISTVPILKGKETVLIVTESALCPANCMCRDESISISVLNLGQHAKGVSETNLGFHGSPQGVCARHSWYGTAG